MKKSTRIKQTKNIPSQSSYSILRAAFFSLIILPTRTRGDVSECYNCYSTDDEGCMDPYYGRKRYNSNILIPDCSYDMARNFHSSLMYVLTRDTNASKVTKVDEGYINKWDDLTRLHSFYCCKALFQVSVASKASRYIMRGCCCAPSNYDQCIETATILKNMSDVAPKNTTYSLEHCSSCGSDRCNSSSTSIVHEVLATVFVVAVLMIYTQSLCNLVTNKLL